MKFMNWPPLLEDVELYVLIDRVTESCGVENMNEKTLLVQASEVCRCARNIIEADRITQEAATSCCAGMWAQTAPALVLDYGRMPNVQSDQHVKEICSAIFMKALDYTGIDNERRRDFRLIGCAVYEAVMSCVDPDFSLPSAATELGCSNDPAPDASEPV